MTDHEAHAPIEVTVVAARLEEIRRRIDAVERRWTHDVEVMLVTKGFGPEAVEVAGGLGVASIGENYAQELRSKAGALEALARRGRRPAVAFIGRLQSNKVRLVADVVDVWASVDRRSLATEVAKRAPGAAILVQVNSTGEQHKGGCAPDDVAALVDAARDEGLVVRGLMTVGPTGRPAAEARPGFEMVRRLVDELSLTVCSMGMSADLEVAVAAGSTQVRLGTALLGPRP